MTAPAPEQVTPVQYAAPATTVTAEPVYMTAPAAEQVVATQMMPPVVTTAAPVFMTAPAAEEPQMQPVGTMSEPVPVATNMRPPVPMVNRGEVLMGGTQQ